MIAAVNTTPFRLPVLRKTNVWYSVCDGNWSDVNIWTSNGLDKKNHTSPQPGDNVYIDHAVTCNVTITVNNVYVSGVLKFDGGTRILTINGDLQAAGAIDQSGGPNTIALNGCNNYIVNYTAGTFSTFKYSGNFNQNVLPLTYYNLTCVTANTKYLSGDIIVNGNLSVGGAAILDFGNYNSTVYGTTTGGNLHKSGSAGLALFVGLVTVGVNSDWDFRGNGNVEFRGGWKSGNDDSAHFWTGAGTYTFSTNNQILDRTYPYVVSSTWYCTVIIAGITLTLGGASGWPVNITLNNGSNGIEGTNAISQLIQYNSMVIQTSVIPPMNAHGIYVLTNSGAVSVGVGYNINTNYTIPDTYFPNLGFYGTGTGVASADMTVNGNLTMTGLGAFEMGAFNLTVKGTTTGAAGSTLSKSGSGSLLFIGAVNTGLNCPVNFSGNPVIEFRGGLTVPSNGYYSGPQMQNFGTGTISFTTNNQVLQNFYSNAVNFNNNITINGVSLVVQTNGTVNADFKFSGTITGSNSSSYLVINANNTIRINNATAPMLIGVLTASSLSNVYYQMSGAQDVLGGTYGNLTLNTGGIKKLLGNVSVSNTYTLTAPATLNSNGFALTNP